MLKPLASVLILAAAPALADRIAAEATCTGPGVTPQFDCRVTLTQSGAPLEGAVFTVKPDMPAMPMAHNLAPVPAQATETPGTYAVPLTLDMFGRWTLRLDIAAPRRDVVILDKDFLPDGTCTDSDGTGHAHSH